MIDFLKIHSLPVLPENIEKHPLLDFPLSNVLNTGELIDRTQVAKYRSLDILIKNKKINGKYYRYVGLKGSPHKYDQGGKNYQDFSFKDIQRIIAEWTKNFAFKAQKATINFIEIGVNIPVNIDPTPLIKSFIMYKHKPFEKLKTTGKGYGRVCCLEQFTIKIYNKSEQNNLPFYLLRVEIKVTRMQLLKKYGIEGLTLADLTHPEIYPKFLKVLLDIFDQILLYNPNLDIDSISNLKDRELVLQGKYPEYWQNLARTTKFNQIKRFSELAESNTLKQELRQSIINKWNELTTLQERPKPRKTERINNTINCYSPVCLITGIDISIQKRNSKLLSVSGLNWLLENNPEKYMEIKKRFLPRSGISGQHPKFEKKETYHIAKQIRNEYYNQCRKQVILTSDQRLLPI